MKRKYKIIISIFIAMAIIQSSNAQCREYIKAMAGMQLNPYVLDGNFLSPEIYEGEQVELTRTFLQGQKYKIMLIGMDMFERKITITDSDGFIIFKNYPSKNSEEARYFEDINGDQIMNFGSTYFEFTAEESQNLTIKVEIEQIAKKKKHRLKGCLGIVVGFAT